MFQLAICWLLLAGRVMLMIDGVTVSAVGDDRCRLFCQVHNNRAFYYPLESKVIDGTKCHPDTSDLCVNGRCVVRLKIVTRNTKIILLQRYFCNVLTTAGVELFIWMSCDCQPTCMDVCASCSQRAATTCLARASDAITAACVTATARRVAASVTPSTHPDPNMVTLFTENH